jgi:hypothetical protein
MIAASVNYYAPGEYAELSHKSFADLSEAVEMVRACAVQGSNVGRHARLAGPGWSASLDRTKAGKAEWAMTFVADGIFRSRACGLAERSGVRYASHRKGYRASERAFSRFVAEAANL